MNNIYYILNIGLGRTVPELDIGDIKPIEKTLFSMCTPEVLSYINEKVPSKFLIMIIIKKKIFQIVASKKYSYFWRNR